MLIHGDCMKRGTHHFHVGALIKSLSEDGHHKHVDEERHKQRDGRLDEEVFVGLLHLLLVGSVHLSGLTI